MKTFRTKAVVLRRTNYGEADRVLQLLTPGHGKLSVMARGVRREKSKMAGGIELFGRSDVTIGQGKGELGVLTSARLDKFYSHILSDYDRMQFGYETIKQVAKATEQLNEPGFFELLDQTFAALDDMTQDLRLIRSWFWLQLAILLGIGLNLATDNNGMKLVEDTRYNFDTTDQVFVYHENGRFSSDHIKFLRILSAREPKVAMHINNYETLIDDTLWLAEQAVAH